jgi:aldose 1-epimerase
MAARARLLHEESVHRLASADFEAVFLPRAGMLGVSLQHRGTEILRRIEQLDSAFAKGGTAGIPLLHPWANRLAAWRYHAAGRDVALDSASPLLHRDANGLPIHGVPWSMLVWNVSTATPTRLAARLDWTRDDLLGVFPFPHWLEMTADLSGDGLMLETTLIAGPHDPVPASFGFHPYLGLPGLRRHEWQLTLPAMRRLTLDALGIPTGAEEHFVALDAALGECDFDDGFALLGEEASLSLSGGGRRISVEFLAGYRFVQIYAPRDQEFIALEPMTAPTNALVSGKKLRLVDPGASFSAAFRIRVEAS